MILIIGGYAQGKETYARAHYENADEHIFRLNDAAEKPFTSGKTPANWLEELLAEDPERIFLSDEVGNGIVPMEKSEREFREWIGHLQIEAARRADEVIRVICGLGQKLK